MTLDFISMQLIHYGQFFTPRHIINMMVELMQPTLSDRILDPAMGSAGFLLSAANYVSGHQKNELMKTENLKYYKKEMFSGFDTDQSMLRIGAMNMMLHGVEDPNIRYAVQWIRCGICFRETVTCVPKRIGRWVPA